VTLACLLIVPAVVYLVLSGRISELKAPGGLEFKLVQAANETVRTGAQGLQVETIPVAELQDVVKGEVSQLQARLQSIDESQPVVFTLVLGSGKYDSWAISQYSAALSQFRSFHTVVFVDKDKHFVACMGARAFRDTLSVQTLADELLRSVNDD